MQDLCRYHYRVKTHGGWHVARQPDGWLLWTSPVGERYTVDLEGTNNLPRLPPLRRLSRPTRTGRSWSGPHDVVSRTDVRSILMEAGRRRLVGGQEDMVVDIALNMVTERETVTAG